MDTFTIWWRRFLSTAMFLTLLAPISPAAEIALKERLRVETGIVYLGDVADVTGDSTAVDSLRRIELFPAPPVGSKRFLRIRELQDILAVRQVNLIENRLSGASVVEIANVPEIVAPTPVKTVIRPNVTRAKSEVRTALVSYLRRQGDRKEAYDAVVNLSDDAAMQLQTADYRFEIRGGETPFTGRQQFELIAANRAEPIAVEAEVTTSPLVAVAVRPVARGAIVQASDVELLPLANNRVIDQALGNVQDVVGREAAQALAAGQVFTKKAVRNQRLVQRGNPVTVTARSSGLKVRTTGRAREDGGLGDIIAIESVLNRQSFFARVVGIDEVEIYARAVEAQSSTDDSSVNSLEVR